MGEENLRAGQAARLELVVVEAHQAALSRRRGRLLERHLARAPGQPQALHAERYGTARDHDRRPFASDAGACDVRTEGLEALAIEPWSACPSARPG